MTAAIEDAGFRPRNEAWEARVRKGFAGQGFMAHLGATLQRVEPGRVAIVARSRDELTQQHRFVHAGVLAALADTAAGFAALTLASDADDILTAEFKINLLRPADGDTIVADAEVLKAGRLLTVCTSRVTVDDSLCAVATVTLANPLASGSQP